MSYIIRNANFNKKDPKEIISRAGDVMSGSFKRSETEQSKQIRKAEINKNNAPSKIPVQAYVGSTVGFGGSNVVTTHPMFYSPIHTPLNWQIPTKRREVYIWCRFFAANNATIKASLRFYSQFPFGGFDNVMRDPVRKEHYDNLKKRLKLEEVILPQIAYEYFALGDAFPFVSISCPTCFPEDTLILTNQGHKKISEIKVGDYVLTKDMSYQEVIKTMSRYYIDDMVRLKVNSFPDLISTDNHPHFVVRPEYRDDNRVKHADWDNPIEIEARNIEVGDYLLCPFGNFLPENCAGIRFDGKKYRKRNKEKALVKDIPLTKDFAYMLGWYMAEGSTDSNRTVSFSLNYSEFEEGENLVRILKDIFEVDPKISQYFAKTTTVVEFYSREISAWFDEHFGHGAENKKVPSFIMQSSKKIKEAFIEGYLDGDGHRRKSRNENTISTCSRNSAYDITALLLNLEKSVYIVEKEAHTDNLGINRKHSYKINWRIEEKRESGKGTKRHGNHFFIKVRDKKIYNDSKIPVFNLTVENNHDYVANLIHTHNCGGWGIDPDGKPCDHKGGKISGVTVLNPDNVDVKINPLNHNQSIITMLPDEMLQSIVVQGQPKQIYDSIPDNIKKLIASKQPIPLSPRAVAHLKHDPIGYLTYGFSIIAPLFPILAYLDRLRQAQWIVAERHILPIKIAKVGNDQRPAGAQDIADMQTQLAQTANDPNLTIVTHHAFDLQWAGAAGKVLQITKEYELIDKEIIKGLGVNEALLSGSGPSYSQAAIGIEATIKRLKVVQKLLSWWIIEYIYKTEAKMQGFYKKDKFGNEVLDYPEIKWHDLNLRDESQRNNMYVQLWEKGIVSTEFICEKLGIDYDTEVERVRKEQQYQLQNGISSGGGGKKGGLGGGFPGGGGFGGGGLPGGDDMKGNLPGGNSGPGLPGDELAPSMSGGEGGGIGAPSGGASMEADDIQLQIQNYEMAKKTKPKVHRPKKYKLKRPKPPTPPKPEVINEPELYEGPRTALFNLTSIERALYAGVEKAQDQGLLPSTFLWQEKPEPARLPKIVVDGIFPDVKLIVQADGERWHSAPDDIRKDQDIDARLARFGWNVLRFTDYEIENQIDAVVAKIIQVYKNLTPENLNQVAYSKKDIIKIASNQYFDYKVGSLMHATSEEESVYHNIIEHIAENSYKKCISKIYDEPEDQILKQAFLKTEDKEWIEENDSNEVNIIKTNYKNLPFDIKDELEHSVIVALQEICHDITKNNSINKKDIVADLQKWYSENMSLEIFNNKNISDIIISSALEATKKGHLCKDEE